MPLAELVPVELTSLSPATFLRSAQAIAQALSIADSLQEHVKLGVNARDGVGDRIKKSKCGRRYH